MSYQMIKEKKIEAKHDPKDLFLDRFEKTNNGKESANKKESEDLPPIPHLAGDEEVKEGKGLKGFNSKQIIN